MLNFDNFLTEKYHNAIGETGQSIRDKYRDEVWEVLQKSYASMGGIKGSGFRDKYDMDKIPFWKIATKDGKVRAVFMYKDKGGRKRVAVGTDGTDEGKALYKNAMEQELKRSYAEVSKASLGAIMKTNSWEILSMHLFSPTEAGKILKEKVVPVSSIPDADIPKDAKMTLSKYPELKPYGYLREIGGSMTFKVMLGKSGLDIR